MTEEQRLRELAKKRFDLIQEQKQRIRELEEENEIYLNCLHGSSKATYTAEMWDKREKETKAKLSRYADLVKALSDLLVWALWIKQHIHRTPRMNEPNTGAIDAARATLDAENGE